LGKGPDMTTRKERIEVIDRLPQREPFFAYHPMRRATVKKTPSNHAGRVDTLFVISY